jgi:hypothetical protein
MALAAGDKSTAQSYFGCVHEDEPQSAANEGYSKFFAGDFAGAQKEFERAKGAAPENTEACQKYQGQFGGGAIEGPTTKKLSPEERSQWPAQPKT